jgi:hypothetical protein
VDITNYPKLSGELIFDNSHNSPLKILNEKGFKAKEFGFDNLGDIKIYLILQI